MPAAGFVTEVGACFKQGFDIDVFWIDCHLTCGLSFLFATGGISRAKLRHPLAFYHSHNDETVPSEIRKPPEAVSLISLPFHYSGFC